MSPEPALEGRVGLGQVGAAGLGVGVDHASHRPARLADLQQMMQGMLGVVKS